MQKLCSEKQDEQILTNDVHNGRIGMHTEVSNEIKGFHWNITHAGWNSSQAVLLYPLSATQKYSAFFLYLVIQGGYEGMR